MDTWTEDRFFNGALRVRQQRNGYRFSLDAVLVAAAVDPKRGDRVVDLGTGCGVIPLILAFRYVHARIYGVEIQKGLADLAQMNRRENRLESRFEVMHADMLDLLPDHFGGPVDWVVCNPPYRRSGSGRINPNRERAVARHEILITMNQVVATASRLLKRGGRLVMIYPAERLVALFAQMRARRIEPKLMQTIYSRTGESAKLVLITGIKEGRPELRLAPPLYIYDENGSYSSQVEGMMQP